MARILVVEDDTEINTAFQLALGQRGHRATGVRLGSEGVKTALGSDPPELLILDLMLPDIDGLEVCRRIREHSMLPIIMMTARGEDADVILGLEAGADDYVVKPVEPALLETRIRAVLRRTTPDTNRPGTTDVLTSGSLSIDRTALKVTKGGEDVPLSPTELRLFLQFSDRPGVVLSREQLLRTVWGIEYLLESRMVDATIQRLRGKIEDDASQPRHIVTIRGFGYRFDRQP
ncbi:two-component system response regulator AfsQ1 [Arthrobacter methylotrophus]|uniref:Response regulator transcription factor n=1 Tax=Arthrobacter methylotrophus TaxID=121291 RepID=A0ABV5ULZ2_9MICC